MGNVSDYATESISLAALKDREFTIIRLEKSTFTKGETTKPSVEITTKNKYKHDGKTIDQFYTTRMTLVKFLTSQQVMDDVNGGNALGPVKCKKVPSQKPGGNAYYVLEDVKKSEATQAEEL